MDQSTLNTVLAIAIPAILTFVGWLINTLITKKIDGVIAQQKEDRELFFKKYDILKDQLEKGIENLTKEIEKEYVLQKLYDQAMQFHQKETDSKFNNLIANMGENFKNVEIDIKDVKGDVKEIKDLINSKFNDKK